MILFFEFFFQEKSSNLFKLKIYKHYFVLRIEERSEYSYIGLYDFFAFLGKGPKICSRSNLIFRGLNFDFYLSSVHLHFVKGRGNFRYRTAIV